MGKIEKILKKGPVEGQTTEVYPVTSTKAVYDENNKRLDNIITRLQESIYLNNTPIDISSENTPESNAQNAKNIADYVEKAKAAGVDTTSPFRVLLIMDTYPLEGIYDTTYTCIYGLKITDDGFAYIYAIDIENGQVFHNHEIVTENSEQKVTSSMLNEGARRPIILTPETTEVDEETYQKLLSDDVDVIFKTNAGNLCTLTYKVDGGDCWILYFTCFSFEGNTIDVTYIYAHMVTITKNSPHNCNITENINTDLLSFFSDSGYLDKYTLSPVLQEIDLTGTDAERKAKLDQFELDWKALTGADNLNGARFVGYSGEPDNFLGIFTYSPLIGGYSAIATNDSLSTYQVFISPTGTIISNSLFYHLEPVVIRTGNTDSDMADNVAAIKKYIDNLTLLGVYTYYGFTIPVSLTGNEFCGYLICNKYHEGDRLVLSGTVFFEGVIKSIVIDETGRYEEIVDIAGTHPLNRTSNSMLDAINELNTIVNKNAFESITLNAGNTNEDMAANVAAINAYITDLKALKVDTTKGFMVSVNVNLPSDSGYYGYMASHYVQGSYFLSGTIFKNSAGENYVKNITINPTGRYDEIVSTTS